MNYTVIWRPAAERALADLWTAGPDRDAITAAADDLDARLRRDPTALGESREATRRIAFVRPLVALIDVSEPDRQAFVLDIDRYGKVT